MGLCQGMANPKRTQERTKGWYSSYTCIPAFFLCPISDRRAKAMDKQFLDMPFEIKAEDVEESGLFKGYAATFGGKPDAHGDIVLPGAFTKTLAKGGRNRTGIAMLWQHRTDEPIGTWPELVEDKKGLKVTGQLIREVPTGDKVYYLLKKGAVKHLSMGYDTIIDEMDNKKKVRYLKEVDL